MLTASRIKEYLRNYDLTKPHFSHHKDALQGEGFVNQHLEFFKHVASDLEENPQQCYNRFRAYLRNHKEILFVLRKMGLHQNVHNPEDQHLAVDQALERFAVFWESAPALRLHTYYLVQRKVPYEKLRNTRSVLSQFKQLGFSSQDAELLRKLRNATYHPGMIKGGYVISDKGEEICQVSQVMKISEKLDAISQFVLLATIHLFIYNPQFSLLLASVCYNEYKLNKAVYKATLGPIFHSLGSRESKDSQPTELKPPKLAQWITTAYHFLKSPLQTIAGTLMGKTLIGAINRDFRRAYNKKDMLALIDAVSIKVQEVAVEVKQIAEKLDENERKSALAFAKSIEHHFSNSPNLERPTDRKFIDFMTRQFNKKYEWEKA